ncbi:MAG: CCA tRNA nucleotidyltransferase [Chloroflexi bacterium]|nr:CCA tRNA nucleotidyltransferase [Chloroflexota bacterium]
MRNPHMRPLPELALRVRGLRGAEAPLYLVGGAVRDWLLERPVHDLDFVLPRGAIAFARQVADALRAAFFVLDPERDVARVIVHKGPERTPLFLDFAAYRGESLEEDLRLRDFTINAMALDPFEPQRLHDPTHGLQDLKDKVLRVCYPRAFLDDPIRILRAVRLSVQLGFRFEAETQRLLRRHVRGLARSSPERQRDELLRILNHPKADVALRVLGLVKALNLVWPELPRLREVVLRADGSLNGWNYSLATGHYLHRLMQTLHREYNPDANANFALGMVSWLLGRYRQQLAEHWNTRLHPYRTLRPILLWAAFYHAVGMAEITPVPGPEGWRIYPGYAEQSAKLVEVRAKALRLSHYEVRRLVRIVRYHIEPLHFAHRGPEALSDRTIHRYFRAAGEAGIDATFVALASVLARYGLSPPHDLWERHVRVARRLFEAWWERHDQVIAPPVLLRGDQVQEVLGIQAGPLVGLALRALQEAQAAGEVHSPDDAILWLREWYQGYRSRKVNGTAPLAR